MEKERRRQALPVGTKIIALWLIVSGLFFVIFILMAFSFGPGARGTDENLHILLSFITGIICLGSGTSLFKKRKIAWRWGIIGSILSILIVYPIFRSDMGSFSFAAFLFSVPIIVLLIDREDFLEIAKEGKPFSRAEVVVGGLVFCLAIASVVYFFIPQKCKVISSEHAAITSRMNQLRTEAVIYYEIKDSYLNLTTDPEASELIECIPKIGGTNFAMNISPDGREYCAEVLMNTGTWYCTDSNLVAKEYTDNPTCSANYYTCE
ncbi:MAG: hypothetical protein CO034_01210 [Parcubacteria group bacterium CG_4_9_14_0_2_um_filter_35_11]|nr:MAG: hypothetical protein COS98_01345 [Parcubacteria group bacterium CG07_land_8_20_14_0_80_35_11]PJC47836.1 MAG: hypothetical protein CO034_01210 [Parcubacteria group bacterium CG_4_9_14_0_2_um_filter_35_11]